MNRWPPLDPDVASEVADRPYLDISDPISGREAVSSFMTGVGGAVDRPPLVGRPVELDRVPCLVYGAESAAGGVLVYAHGGGFVAGSAALSDSYCQQLASAARCVVVNVDYRLAPEHPFPAATNDLQTVLDSCLEGALGFDVKRGRLAVGGTSAGGALAASLAQRDADGPRQIGFQLLDQPVLESTLLTLSASEVDLAPVLDSRFIEAMWNHYLGGKGPDTPYAVPGRRSHLAGLPATHLTIAQSDPLRDDALRYAWGLLPLSVNLS